MFVTNLRTPCRLPPPVGDDAAPLTELLVDSWYDAYLGVVILVRVKNGKIRQGTKIQFMSSGTAYEVDRVGVFTPKRLDVAELRPGEVGFITASIKAVADCSVGDTITAEERPAAEPLP